MTPDTPMLYVPLRDFLAATANEEDIKLAMTKIRPVDTVKYNYNTGLNYITKEYPPNARYIARYIHADAMIAAKAEVKK